MKKIITPLIFTVLICSFLLAFFLSSKKHNEYWGNQSQLYKADSVHMKVTEVRYKRGYLSFNRSLYVSEGRIINSTLELWRLADIELPFVLNKEVNNDTLKIITKNKEYLIIYR